MTDRGKRRTKRWLSAHRQDAFVRRAAQEGYRSRAAYKLMEIDRRDRLLRPGMTVVDLGAAPGGWSQYAASRVGDRGIVVAVDCIAMAPPPGVRFVHGDFTESGVQSQVKTVLEGRPVDLVISDLAPNITGVAAVDQARTATLLTAALAFAESILKREGTLLVKMFEGSESNRIRAECDRRFRRCAVRKPSASRARSREFYLLAQGFLGPRDDRSLLVPETKP